MTTSTKLTAALVNVAMGRAKADLVIRDGRWVSVQSGEMVPIYEIPNCC
jgi:adenine deaminase